MDRKSQSRIVADGRRDQDCRRLIAAIRHPIYRGCFALIYACGLRISEGVTPEPMGADRT